MDQNALFQMTSTATKYFPWINIQDCFKDDFGEKNFDHFLMRAVTIQNARSTVYNIWDAFSGYTTRRAFRHPNRSLNVMLFILLKVTFLSTFE